MAVTLHGSLRSPFTLTVALTLYEKGQEFDLVLGDMKSPEYLKNMNPFGKVPSYQDEDITMFESKAIARYIANKHEGQGSPLWGSSAKENGLIEQWMEVNSHHFMAPLHILARELKAKAADPNHGSAALDEAVASWGKTLDIYEARLAESKYLAGEAYTLADLVHTPILVIFSTMIDAERRKIITDRPHVSAWLEDISSRPAWKKVLQRPEAADYGQHNHPRPS